MKTKLLKIISVMFILSIVFVLQKTKINFSKMYADTAYNVCAMSNFRLAGCERFLPGHRICLDKNGVEETCNDTNKKYEKIGEGPYFMSSDDYNHYSNKISGTGFMFGSPVDQYTEKDMETLRLVNPTNSGPPFFDPNMNVSSYDYLDCDEERQVGVCTGDHAYDWKKYKTLFTPCNNIVSNFHPGGVTKWLLAANLPVMEDLKNKYNNIVRNSSSETDLLLLQGTSEEVNEKNSYVDISISAPRLIMKPLPPMIFAVWYDKEIVKKDEILTVSWDVKNATHCEINELRSWKESALMRVAVMGKQQFVVKEEFTLVLKCYNKNESRTHRQLIMIDKQFIESKEGTKNLSTQASNTPVMTRNRFAITITNLGNKKSGLVAVEYVPVSSFYPMHISGTHYSTADLAPAYTKEKVTIGGDDHEIVSETKNPAITFRKRDYMKNIQNEAVQKYCLEDFVHWDKEERAKRSNFCLAAQLKATTVLMAKSAKINVPGLSWYGSIPTNSLNAYGNTSFIIFNRDWQEWMLKYFEKMFDKYTKLPGRPFLPPVPGITEMIYGTEPTEKIETPQILFSRNGANFVNNSITFYESGLAPGESRTMTFYVLLPTCPWKRGGTCDVDKIQYGFWRALLTEDSNIKNNFVYKTKVEGISNLVGEQDIYKWYKKDFKRQFFIDYICQSAIVVTAGMLLQHY